MSELPSGAVTFLFTDVEGSTRLLKQLRDRYGEVLAEHGRVLRDVFARHGGRVVDTQGDSFFVAFGSVRGAVLAAVEAQRALAEHDWPEATDVRVRMGIHTGQAAATEERYVGLAVHRAARIAAAGHGGQILVSQTTHNLLEDEEEELPGLDLRDLGEHRLKDLDRPVRLFEVTGAGLRTDFPPLRTEAPAPAAAPGFGFRTRRRTILVGALAGIIAAAVAVTIFALGGGGSSGVDLAETEGSAVAMLDSDSGAVRRAVDLPAPPTAVAVGLGYIWVASAAAAAVFVVDPETNTVRDRIPVESAPGDIAIAGGLVWVTNTATATVSQISPQTLDVVNTIPVGNGPTGIAAGEGHVWVANTSDHTVSKLRASDGKPLARFSAGTDPGAIAAGEGAVWVASKLTSALLKLSPSTGEILDRIPVGDGPAGVAVGVGSIWVANSLSGTVSRVDPRTGDVRGTIEVGSSADTVAVARNNVWVANGQAGKLARVDAPGGRVTPFEVGNRPTALAAADGTLYLGLAPSGASHVGGTLRVALPHDPPQVDPGNAYTLNSWSVLAMTNDGLLGWKRAGGQPGVELVPDLAVSLPSISGDRRSYTFQLRDGIHYSDGRLVKASDFRHSLERVYKLKPAPEPVAVDLYRTIAGADRCKSRPARCDLSRGIVTDDRAGTVVFHLSAPDPEFLLKLTLPFAFVVPRGTTPRQAVERPLPATGPYQVASVTPGRSVRLVRNPRFREWSHAAQPAGFSDEIFMSHVPNSPRRVRLVVEGEADWTQNAVGEPFAVPPVYRSQLHVQTLPTTVYLALDTTRPPFDDVRVRRAVNYALDRTKVVRLAGGPDLARPSCQVLPPNFPGYSEYCPYTLQPSAGSGWRASDVAKARKLVAASGTARTPISLWWHNEIFGEPQGRYVESLLDSLGYRTRLRTFSGDPLAYFSAVERPGGPWQSAGYFTISNYPAASAFITRLLCADHLNLGRFCDRAIDAKISRALRLQERDPASANESWSALDRELTDRAPWAFLYTESTTGFVSKRVGNYQYHPFWGTLFAQLWVR